jgi:hypothetical protein
VFDRAVAGLLDELGVEAELVRSAPGLHAAIARNEAVAVTTAPAVPPAGVLVRPLDPLRTIQFELLWRDETPSPALAEFTSLAAAVPLAPQSRALAAVA